jgi:transposase
MVTDLERGEYTTLRWASEFLIQELVELMFIQAATPRRTLKRIYADLPLQDQGILEGLPLPDETPDTIVACHLATAAEFLPRVRATSTSLRDIRGVGVVTAAMIIGHVGDVSRFKSAAHFASYNGTAPIEASSGERRRHRLNPRGNRQLNYAIHVARSPSCATRARDASTTTANAPRARAPKKRSGR